MNNKELLIEINDLKKSYLSDDMQTYALAGVNIKINIHIAIDFRFIGCRRRRRLQAERYRCH